jgi:flagellar motor switch protein FliN/FliY
MADDTTDGTGGQDSPEDRSLELDDLGEGTDDSSQNLLSMEEAAEPMRNAKDLEAVYDIPVQLSAVLGKASMQVSQLLKLGRGAVVELDRKVGEAIDIYVNNRLVARGEVVVVEERLGVTMTEIIKSDRVA